MSEFNKNTAKRAHRVLEIAARMAQPLGWTVSGPIEEMWLHFDGYAEPGCNAPNGIVATGNWNEVTRWNGTERIVVSDLPKRVGDIFERMGIECEWSDEWSTCSDCGKLVRTSADSYSWQPSYWLPPGAGELLCIECVKEDPIEYLQAHEGSTNTCLTIDSIDPEEHGYVKHNTDPYESGGHPGQTDHPEKVAKDLRACGIERFLFRLDENSQFYSRWSVYVHADEFPLLKGESSDAADESES